MTSDQRLYLRPSPVLSRGAIPGQASNRATSTATGAAAGTATGAAAGTATGAATGTATGAATGIVNARALIEELIPPLSETATTTPPPLLVRTSCVAEHELLRAQALHHLSQTLLTAAAVGGSTSGRRQVPLALSMTRLAEFLQEEAAREVKLCACAYVHAPMHMHPYTCTYVDFLQEEAAREVKRSLL
jgi:hypothetical protein